MKTLKFTTWIDRDGLDREVKITAQVEDYAATFGVPSEYRERFAGRRHVEIVEVSPDDLSLTDDELEVILEKALDSSLTAEEPEMHFSARYDDL